MIASFLAVMRGLRSAFLKDAMTQRLAYALIMATLTVITASIIVDVAKALGLVDRSYQFMNLSVERSFPEIYSHVITTLCIIILALCHRRHGGRVFIALIAFQFFVLIDEALEYHDIVGEKLAVWLDLGSAPGAGPNDTGQLAAWGIAALVLAGPFAWALAGAREGEARILAAFLPPFVLLVFTGVVLDLAHVMVRGFFERPFGWAEDGGELMAITLATALAQLFLRDEHAVFLNPAPQCAPRESTGR